MVQVVLDDVVRTVLARTMVPPTLVAVGMGRMRLALIIEGADEKKQQQITNVLRENIDELNGYMPVNVPMDPRLVVYLKSGEHLPLTPKRM